MLATRTTDPIHDHNGSQGAVMVYEGLMWETTFNFDPGAGLSTNRAASMARAKSLTLPFLIFIN